MTKHGLSVFIEPYHSAIGRHFFKWMPNIGAGLVMLNLNCRRCIPAPIVGPGDATGQDIFGTLQPLKADYGCGRWLRMPSLNCFPSKIVDGFSINGCLNFPDPTLRGNTTPRIRDILVEGIGI